MRNTYPTMTRTVVHEKTDPQTVCTTYLFIHTNDNNDEMRISEMRIS